MQIQIKRVYAEPATGDGLRVLVDRIWPRGMSKDKAQVDEWLKELAPSAALRKWFGHDPAKWEEYQKRYFADLSYFTVLGKGGDFDNLRDRDYLNFAVGYSF